ncbi:shikimate kinase [Enterovirga rhinocerotis]|uniref:Shikimate kinase n=1 Tax=Enterovirga rhinocerotis TaxID=1339210 RepID=A0A4V6PZM7_9HYPH|nr:shikimate kinase [Enterovirga rhinocerotis]TDR93559.1 shikimate kinase [Enterovirga rhinocerotis]
MDNNPPTVPARPGDDDGRAALLDRLGSRSIVLVGLMGAGKTTIGKRLASRLGLPFRDADHEIERSAGMPIADIFTIYGEAAFRDGERRVIARMLEDERMVLATGGGAYMNEDTRGRIRDRGVSVWLRADHDTLMRRVRRRGNRPLLRNPDPDGTMRRLMAERYPVYGLADVTVQSIDASHDQVTQDVLDTLTLHLTSEPLRDPG